MPPVRIAPARGVGDAEGAEEACSSAVLKASSATIRMPPLQHPQPRGREVQFRLGAVLQHSRTPSLRVARFEDEDDDEDEDEDENEAPCEGGPSLTPIPGVKTPG